MTRNQELKNQIDKITLDFIKSKQVKPKSIILEICTNLNESLFTSSWTIIKTYSGIENKLISELGFIKCKKTEATGLIICGERPEWCNDNESGLWKKGVKNIWVKKNN